MNTPLTERNGNSNFANLHHNEISRPEDSNANWYTSFTVVLDLSTDTLIYYRPVSPKFDSMSEAEDFRSHYLDRYPDLLIQQEAFPYRQ
jgi:hypothetical protein